MTRTKGLVEGIKRLRSENSMKEVFLALKKARLLEPIPDLKGSASAWRKFTGEVTKVAEDLFGNDEPARADTTDDDAQSFAESRPRRPTGDRR